jgi:hypothetical protein
MSGPIDYLAWAGQRLDLVPDAVLHPDDARVDYVGWCSDRMARPEPRSRQRAAVRAFGARCRGVGADLRYHGIELRPLVDSRYRAGVGYLPSPPGEVLAGLRVLQAAGMVTDRDALNRAYRELVADA